MGCFCLGPWNVCDYKLQIALPQSLAFFGHQDSQENTSSLETSAVAGAVFAGTETWTESIAEKRTSIVGLATRKIDA